MPEMKITLLACTPEPDFVCAQAAGISTGTKINVENYAKLLKKVLGYGHSSIIEHASFTFLVEGISRACSHQLVRHRIASYTQESQRYVAYDKISCTEPDSIIRNEEAKRVYDDFMKECEETYLVLQKMGIKPEDARYVLPNAAHTKIMITMNGRELLHFFGLRLCTRAQWEIREMAGKMLEEARKAAPVIFEKADAQCASLGYCPEREGCGRFPKKQENERKGL